MTRQQAITAIESLSSTDLKTIANAALLAAIELKSSGYPSQGPNAIALTASVRTVIGGGVDISG